MVPTMVTPVLVAWLYLKAQTPLPPAPPQALHLCSTDMLRKRCEECDIGVGGRALNEFCEVFVIHFVFEMSRAGQVL